MAVEALEREAPVVTDDGLTIQDLSNLLDALRTRVNQEEEARQRLEKEYDLVVEELEETRDELAEATRKLEKIDARTDMLQIVQQSDSLEPSQRAAVYVQTLVNDALNAQKRGREPKASMTVREGHAAVGKSIDRTSMYDDFRDAEKLVDNPNILWFDKQPRGASDVSKLKLDMTAGDLPAVVGGYDISTEVE